MTTCGSREEAEKLAEGVVAAKLAACVQISEVASVYEWEGELKKEKEFLLFIKGRADLFPELRDYIFKNHSYAVPEVVQVDIADGSPAYLAWMQGS